MADLDVWSVVIPQLNVKATTAKILDIVDTSLPAATATTITAATTATASAATTATAAVAATAFSTANHAGHARVIRQLQLLRQAQPMVVDGSNQGNIVDDNHRLHRSTLTAEHSRKIKTSSSSTFTPITVVQSSVSTSVSSPSSATTNPPILVTCMVEAGAVKGDPSWSDLYAKELMDIAVSVAEGTGDLQSYLDTALFVVQTTAMANPTASTRYRVTHKSANRRLFLAYHQS